MRSRRPDSGPPDAGDARGAAAAPPLSRPASPLHRAAGSSTPCPKPPSNDSAPGPGRRRAQRQAARTIGRGPAAAASRRRASRAAGQAEARLRRAVASDQSLIQPCGQAGASPPRSFAGSNIARQRTRQQNDQTLMLVLDGAPRRTAGLRSRICGLIEELMSRKSRQRWGAAATSKPPGPPATGTVTASDGSPARSGRSSRRAAGADRGRGRQDPRMGSACCRGMPG